MAGIPFVFANESGQVGAAQLDANFAYVLANATLQPGATIQGRTNWDPSAASYDLFSGSLAAMIYFGAGSQTVPASKELAMLRGDNTWTVGANALAHFINMNITVGAASVASGNVRGVVANMINAGPATVSGMYAHVSGTGASVGDIIANKNLTTPGALTANAISHQIAFDTTARKVDKAIWFNSNAGVASVDYGILAGTDVAFNNAFIQGAAVGAGPAFLWKNSDASADLLTIFATGALTSAQAITGKELRASGDAGGAASQNALTNVSDVTANSTGVGTILFKGATSRNSAGFIKIYVGVTPFFVPIFAAISG